MNIICIRKFQIVLQEKLQLENMTTNAVQRYDLCCLREVYITHKYSVIRIKCL